MAKPTTTTPETKAAAIEDVKAIFEEWDDERNRMFALVSSIASLLEDKPGNPSPAFNAWKLTQVANVNFFKKQWGLL